MKEKKKNYMLSVRIDEELHNELKALAKKHNCKVADVVNSRLGEDSSRLDKRAVLSAVLDIAFYIDQQDKMDRKIESEYIKERLLELCTLLN